MQSSAQERISILKQMDFNYCLNYNTKIGIIEIHITNIYHNLKLYQYQKR